MAENVSNLPKSMLTNATHRSIGMCNVLHVLLCVCVCDMLHIFPVFLNLCYWLEQWLILDGIVSLLLFQTYILFLFLYQESVHMFPSHFFAISGISSYWFNGFIGVYVVQYGVIKLLMGKSQIIKILLTFSIPLNN
jgi:hypothetical protein